MRKLLSLLLACLLLAGCESTTVPVEPAPPAPTTEPAPESAPPAGDYPRMDGSTSTHGIVGTVWESLYQDETWYSHYEPSKTVPAYHRLIEGEADLIFVPYASADVLQTAEDAGVELEFYKVAAEALIFVTPLENTAENITGDQVREIYLNYGITNWEELGGPDKELVPICRNADSGSQSQMDNLILKGEKMHPDIQDNYVELTMEGLLEQVAFYHNGGLDGRPTDSYALGYTLYTYLRDMTSITGIGDNLKILDYEGVAPTEGSISDGSYPLTDGYYAVVRGDLPEDHSAREVIQWLQSEDGIAALQENGYIPAGEESEQ